VFFLHNELRRRLGKSLQFVKSVLDCLARFYFFTGEKKHFPVQGCVSHQNFLRCSFVHAPTFQRVKMISDSLKVFSGNANPKLAHAVAQYLNIPLGRATVNRFSDGEVMVEINENVRGCDAFVLQSTCAPTNDNLMELMIMVDALRRASCRRITAVMPYYGYARQDRRPRSARVAISAKVVANMLQSVGIDRVLTMDLHADQIQGFFDVPVDNIYSTPVLLNDLVSHQYPDLMVVSPDVGGVVRARAMAKELGVDLAIIDKRRPRANVAEIMNIIGEVKGRTCVITDDIVDTAGTLCNAAGALKERGATRVLAYAAHPVFSGNAIERIKNSALDEVVVTDTIPLRPEAQECPKIRQLSCAPLVGETISRIAREDSVSELFNE
jgi:ribose-phosphate diphosphokinase